MKIIGINIVLSGDNTVVIALACRNLPPVQQKREIFFGGMAAKIMLRGRGHPRPREAISLHATYV